MIHSLERPATEDTLRVYAIMALSEIYADVRLAGKVVGKFHLLSHLTLCVDGPMGDADIRQIMLMAADRVATAEADDTGFYQYLDAMQADGAMDWQAFDSMAAEIW